MKKTMDKTIDIVRESFARREKETGITLVALITTIIILIILAAVTIYTYVESGLFKTASKGVEYYENAQEYEKQMMDNIDKQTQNIIGNMQSGTGSNEISPDEPDEPDEPEKPETIDSISKKLGYITNGLLLHYDGINNTGNEHSTDTTIWKDLSGNNRDGILEGCTWKENALLFDGRDDGVNIGNNLSELFNKDCTIEIVILFEEDNTRDILITNYNTSHSIALEKDSSGKPRVWINDGKYDNYSSGPSTAFLINKFQNITYVVNKSANTMKMNRNSSQIATYTNSQIGSYNYAWNNARLGRDYRTGGTCLKGQIAAVRIYNRQLSNEELRKNYERDRIRFNF